MFKVYGRIVIINLSLRFMGRFLLIVINKLCLRFIGGLLLLSFVYIVFRVYFFVFIGFGFE